MIPSGCECARNFIFHKAYLNLPKLKERHSNPPNLPNPTPTRRKDKAETEVERREARAIRVGGEEARGRDGMEKGDKKGRA